MEIKVRLSHHTLSPAEEVLEVLKGGPLASIEKEMLGRSIRRRIRKSAEQVTVTPQPMRDIGGYDFDIAVADTISVGQQMKVLLPLHSGFQVR